jgi:hypothetical protein
MRTLFPVLGLFPALLLASGCEPMLLSAEIDAQEICVSGLTVPFAPSGYSGDTDSPISGEDLGFPDSDNFVVDVRVLSVGMTPAEGVTDLEFLDALSVSAAPADPASALPELMLIEMDEADHTSDGAMYAESANPADIADHLREGDVFFRFALSGDLPDEVWMADMDLCVHAVARYNQPF